MRGSVVESALERGRVLNAVALQNAVLCAECDVDSDSPHDQCLVCGSRSLFNIARIFGGKLPKQRASLIAQGAVEITSREVVFTFAKPHRLRRRATVGSRQLVELDDNETDEVNCGVLLGPNGR
jgi:hypothetical protein